jgi:hypothetical protein
MNDRYGSAPKEVDPVLKEIFARARHIASKGGTQQVGQWYDDVFCPIHAGNQFEVRYSMRPGNDTVRIYGPGVDFSIDSETYRLHGSIPDNLMELLGKLEQDNTVKEIFNRAEDIANKKGKSQKIGDWYGHLFTGLLKGDVFKISYVLSPGRDTVKIAGHDGEIPSPQFEITMDDDTYRMHVHGKPPENILDLLSELSQHAVPGKEIFEKGEKLAYSGIRKGREPTRSLLECIFGVPEPLDRRPWIFRRRYNDRTYEIQYWEVTSMSKVEITGPDFRVDVDDLCEIATRGEVPENLMGLLEELGKPLPTLIQRAVAWYRGLSNPLHE